MGNPETALAESLVGGASVAWSTRAKCRTLPYDWFPETRHSIGSKEYEAERRRLDAICNLCPVADDCLDEALALPAADDDYGIRAGTNQIDRRRLRRRR